MLQFNVLGPSKVSKASSSADGTIPARAHQYCEALRLASSAGFYVLPGVEFDLSFNGHQISVAFWKDGRSDGDQPVRKNIFFPGFERLWDEKFPDLAGMCPPNIGCLREIGHFQIWTGVYVQSNGDSKDRLWVKYPANVPPMPGIHFYEGIINVDNFPRPLFINGRFTTSAVASFSEDRPVIQAFVLQLSPKNEKVVRFEIDAETARRSITRPDDDQTPGKYASEQRRLCS